MMHVNNSIVSYVIALAFAACLFSVGGFQAFAAEGDYAIYREITAGDAITTTPIDLTWDTTVFEGNGFQLRNPTPSSRIRLQSAGIYFVTYNVAYQQVGGGGDRREIQTQLEVDGVLTPYGRATCYIRNASGADTCVASGSTVLETLGNNEEVVLTTFRTDSSLSGAATLGNQSGFTVLRLEDGWETARIQETGGGQALDTSTWTAIDWDTNDRLDAAMFARTGSDITLKEAGHYLVTTNVMFQTVGGARRDAAIRLVLDGVEISGSRTTSYLRGTNSTNNHSANYAGIIETSSANQVLSVEARCDGSVCGGVENIGGETTISIVRLRDSADYIRLTDIATNQAASTTAPVEWDTQLELTGISFDHDIATNNNRINFGHTGLENYWFLGSFYMNRSLETNTRMYPFWQWRLNGASLYQYGSFGKFSRGNGYISGGDSGSIILHQTSNTDYLDLRNSNETTSNDATAFFPSSRIGVQGVNLTQLFTPVPIVKQIDYRWRPIDSTTTLNDATTWGAAENDSLASKVQSQDDLRLRISAVNNGDGTDTVAREYTLQYAEQATTCAAATGWSDVAGAGGAFDMVDVVSFADGDATSQVLSNGFGYSFTAGEGRDVLDTTGAIGPLNEDAYTELEYSFEVTNNAAFNTTYCFRLFDAATGSELDSYASYPTVEMVGTSIEQLHYRFRPFDTTAGLNDNASGDWAQSEDINPVAVADQNTAVRLRMSLGNTDLGTPFSGSAYQLQYAQKNRATCNDTTGWVDDAADAIDPVDDANYANQDVTSALFTNAEGFAFESGEGIDATDTTGVLPVFGGNEYTELEFSIEVTPLAPKGTEYCFRLYDDTNNQVLDNYQIYPKLRTLGGLKTQIISGSITGALSKTEPLVDPVGSLSQAFVLAEVRGDLSADNDPNEGTCTAYLSAVDEITIQKDAVGGTCAYEIKVIEALNGEFEVRGRGEIQILPNDFTATGTANNLSAITDINQVFVPGNFRSDGGGNFNYDSTYSTLELTNATTVTAERGQNDAITTSLRYEVVEWLASGVTVQTGTTDLTGLNNTPITQALVTAVDSTRSWLYTTFRHSANGLAQTSITADLSNTDISYARNAGTAYNSVASYAVIEFPAEVVAQRGSGSDGSGTNDLISIIPSPVVDMASSFSGVTNANSGTGSAFPRTPLASQLIQDDLLELRSGNSGNSQAYSWQIIDTSDWVTATGPLSVDIVDASGVSVPTPGVSFPDQIFSFDPQNSVGTLGTSLERIRVSNGTLNASWELSLSTSLSTDVWSGVGASYDFNDENGAVDGVDVDSLGGQLEVDPQTATITPEAGCTNTGITLSPTEAYEEGVVDSILLVSSSGSADTNCFWDFTDITLDQLIPGEQAADTYSIDMVLSILAI